LEARIVTERGYLNDIRRKCVALGVWRDEFERVQRRLAKVYCRIDDVEAKYTENGGKPIITHKNNKGSENDVRNPYLVELDTLYDQALAYEKELGLTAAALKKSHRQTANLLYRAKQSLRTKLEKEGFIYEEL
jgi:hypothetical protein